VRNAALQFVRKISGATKPSKANEAAFEAAVDEVTASCQRMLASMVTRRREGRETEALKARERSRKRFGQGQRRIDRRG
jgi:hypothetical protein